MDDIGGGPDPLDLEGGDYGVVRLRINLGILSIAAFALILVAHLFGMRVFRLSIAMVTGATLLLSVGGLVTGLLGMRFGRRRRTARLGVFLNGAVLFCFFVILPVTFWVLRWLR